MLWEDNYLAHYGIKGQKWGVQKKEPTTGTIRSYGGGTAKTMSVRQTPVAQNSVGGTSAGGSSLESRARDNKLKTNHGNHDSHDTTGRFGRGNIDLNKRQVVRNEDGSISTERSFSVNIDGKETLLPTVIDGRIVSEDEAIDHYYKTGEHLGQFDTVEEASAYAEELHNRQDWYYNQHLKERKKQIKSILKSLKN